MKNKDITYSRFQTLVKGKDTSVNYYIQHYLNVCQSMFNYDGLPDSVPQDVLERQLQVNGNVFWVKDGGDLYALTGALGGELDMYYRPTRYIVANPYLHLEREFTVDKDGVLMKNDTEMQGLLPIIGKYAVLLTDSEISLNMAAILTRITMLISASDDKTKASADIFVKKILDGEFSVIGENAFFDGVKMQTSPTANSSYITQLVELVQYYKAGLLNELGLNANWNAKRERLITTEVNTNIDLLLPFVDDMLTERRKALELVNKMFGTEISVELSSAWLSTHETKNHTDETETDTDETETETDETETDTDETETDTDETETDTDETETETDEDEEKREDEK